MRTVLFLLLTLSLWTMTSCMSSRPPNVKPETPQIDCSERAPAEPLPRRPALAKLPESEQSDSWWRAYVRRLTAVLGGYEIRLIGWGTTELVKRNEVADCYDRERAAGRIR